jgi:hypothetical protein
MAKRMHGTCVDRTHRPERWCFDSGRRAAGTQKMRKRILLSAAVAATVAASPSFSQSWLSVRKDVDSVDAHTYEILLDQSSIRVKAAQPNIRTATVKYIRTAPNSTTKLTDRVAYSITFKSFRCDALGIRLDTSEIHFPDGSLQYVDTRGKGAWHTPHDPASRQILDFVCAVKNPKAEEAPPS